MSSSNPLATLSSLIDTSTPHLASLHKALDLPADALKQDLGRLEAILRKELEGLVGEREKEVKEWNGKVQAVEQECLAIGRAVGADVDLRAWIEGEQILPRRLAMLETYRDDHLLPQYQTRLAEVETLRARLTHLAKILPPSFNLTPASTSAHPHLDSHPHLHSMPPTSIPKHPPSNIPRPAISSTLPTLPSSIPLPLSPSIPNLNDLPALSTPSFELVTDASIAELKHLIDEGELERIRLLNFLRHLLLNLIFLLPEVDLSLPLPYPLPTPPSPNAASSTHPPSYSQNNYISISDSRSSSPSPSSALPLPLIPIPSQASTESHSSPHPEPINQSLESKSFYEILQRFGTWLETLPEDLDLDEDPSTAFASPALASLPGGALGGLTEVEPTSRLLSWVEETTKKLRELKRSREGRIQAIYDQLEPLWCRLDIRAEDIEEFVGMHQGSGEACVAAYQAELDRMLALKVEYMEVFITRLRTEIKDLQDELLFGDDEREAFADYWGYNYTDALLLSHENELARLQEELEAKRELLQLVLQWNAIRSDEAELLEIAKDPSRLTGRGKGAHAKAMAETKMRNRVDKLKPKIEAELLRALPVWEDRHQRPFMADGQNVLSAIQAAVEAKEAEKEARKRARTGGASAAMVPPSHRKTASSSTSANSRNNPPPTPSIRQGSVVPPPPSTVKRPLSSSTTSSSSTRLPPANRQRMTPSISATPRPAPSSSSHLPRPAGTASRIVPPSSRNFSGSSIASSAYSHASSAAASASTAATSRPSATALLSLSSSTSSTGSSASNVFGSHASNPAKSKPPPAPSAAYGGGGGIGRVGLGVLGGAGRADRRQSFRPRKSFAPPPRVGLGSGWSSDGGD